MVSPTDGRAFQQAPGVGEAPESLVCCSPWGHKKSDTTELLNNKEDERRGINELKGC